MYHPFLIYPSAGDLDFAGPSTVSTIKLAKFTEATTAPSQVFGTTAPWSPGEMPREEDSSFEKHQEMLLNIQRIHGDFHESGDFAENPWRISWFWRTIWFHDKKSAGLLMKLTGNTGHKSRRTCDWDDNFSFFQLVVMLVSNEVWSGF